MTKEQVIAILRVIAQRVFGPGLTPRVRGIVEQLFILIFHFIDQAQTLWNSAGGLVANSVRAVVSQARSLALGLIDTADQFITGTYRAVNPKIPPEA